MFDESEFLLLGTDEELRDLCCYDRKSAHSHQHGECCDYSAGSGYWVDVPIPNGGHSRSRPPKGIKEGVDAPALSNVLDQSECNCRREPSETCDPYRKRCRSLSKQHSAACGRRPADCPKTSQQANCPKDPNEAQRAQSCQGWQDR